MKKLLAALTVIIPLVLLCGCKSMQMFDELLAEAISERFPQQTPHNPESSHISPPIVNNEPEAEPMLNEKYLEYIGKSYAELAAAFGESSGIYANMEWGLYASFPSADISCLLAADFTQYYDDLGEWLTDETEFEPATELADPRYIGSKFAMNKINVSSIAVYGEAVKELFIRRGELDLNTAEEILAQPGAGYVSENEMHGTLETSNYTYKNYVLRFDVERNGNSYSILSANIRRAVPYDAYTSAIVGRWLPDEQFSAVIDNSTVLEISPDNAFTLSTAAGKYTGWLSVGWEAPTDYSDFPVKLIFNTDAENSRAASNGFYWMDMTLYEGEIYLSLRKTINEEMLLDDIAEDNALTFKREKPGSSSHAAIRADSFFPAAFWLIDNDKGEIWLKHVVFKDGKYICESIEAVRYEPSPDIVFDILGNDLFSGQVYDIRTDSQGRVIKLAAILESTAFEKSLAVLANISVYRANIALGMSPLSLREISIIEGATCHIVYVGANYPGQFIREKVYAVNIDDEIVYEYDATRASWRRVR